MKPDNILLDDAGHAHLTDFNVAVRVADRKGRKTDCVGHRGRYRLSRAQGVEWMSGNTNLAAGKVTT